MKVLIGCEESQEVCKAFRELGHEAYSCDIQDCSGGHPEWHIKGDVLEVINESWDLGIFHPPCTYISKAGARWLFNKGSINANRYKKGIAAKLFFETLLNANIDRIAVENPTPMKIFCLPPYTQVIQPYEYGHHFSKRTLLWLKNLAPLKPTNVKSTYVPYLPSNTGGAKRGQKATPKHITQKKSSKTFPGIAKAMAEQWGGECTNELSQTKL